MRPDPKQTNHRDSAAKMTQTYLLEENSVIEANKRKA